MKKKRIVIAVSSSLAMLLAGFLLVTYPPNQAISKVTSSLRSSFYPGFGIWLPPDYDVHGIDVSRHQRRIDWEAVSTHTHNNVSINFAFIKASEGRTVKDNFFDENWKSAKDNNILRGAYHFFRPHLTADEQFLLFKSRVKLEKEDLPPVLDVEMRGSTPPARMKKNVKRWLELAEKHYGVTPILYTSYSFYKNYFSGKEFKKYPLWIAHYATEDLNRLTDKWNFWQHNESGRVKGIRGDVDFNVFKGDYDDLLKLCKK
ncbi:MAG: glycoside hydrolase family 25 protein [Bacteroidetes bacterium]|nr:glycoside hydrolase family 25 protein [Bacteroidota bacterium]MCK6611692.1 glycoside hydrolase family 25 protein [Bacteroidia bacterium]